MRAIRHDLLCSPSHPQTAGEAIEADTINAQSAQAAVAMAQWFGRETGRVYALLKNDTVDTEPKRVVELIQRRGGHVNARN